MTTQSRQLAAIMFTDIVGYTALMGEDEERAFRLLKENRHVQRPIIERHGGKWLKEMGDGILASFTTVSDAVYCAKEIQEACINEEDLKLRIGIHEGEVVFEDEDVFGDAVNIASRLEAIAPVGGICISESVHKNVLNKKGIETEFVKEWHLKNVKEPVRIYKVEVSSEISGKENTTKKRTRIPNKVIILTLAIAIILLLVYSLKEYLPFSKSELKTNIDKSIAVLPFKDDSEGSDSQYFCDGMMDEILTHLQKIADLGVKSRTAVEPYRNSTLGFDAIAKELEVAYILEGAVRKYGDSFRVTTQLIDVESGNHLWSDTYDGIYSDTIFIVQTSIAKKIATSLNAVITPSEEKRIDLKQTNEITAYDFLIRGRYEMSLYYRTGDKKHLKDANDQYDKALEIDPNYADAFIAKASNYLLKDNRNLDSMILYVNRAIEIDPDNPSAYSRKARYYQVRGKLDSAIHYYLKSLQMNPNSIGSNLFLGQVYCRQRKDIRKGYPYIKKAMKLIGIDPAVTYDLGRILLRLGEYGKAEIYLRRYLNTTGSCRGLGAYNRLLLTEGNYNKALNFTDSICPLIDCDDMCNEWYIRLHAYLSEFVKAEQYIKNWEVTAGERIYNPSIGYVYHKLGRIKEAEEVFNIFIKNNESKADIHVYDRTIDYRLAQIHAFQNKKREALQSIMVIAKKGFNFEMFDLMIHDPMFENLWDDAEFKAILKKAQDEKAAIRTQIREMEESRELDL